MSRPWQILLLAPPAYPHVAAFRELAEGLHHALRRLGHGAPIVLNHLLPGHRPIVLAYHMLPLLAQAPDLPADAILYNLEQLPGIELASHAQLRLLLQYEVWDYSERNLAWLRQQGGRGHYLPVGWQSELQRIVPVAEPDIDVLFYGTMSARREAVLTTLQARGLAVSYRYGLYGAERDALVARARVVLNLHNRPAQIFEQLRVSHLLGNGCAVVAEANPDTELPADLAAGLLAVPYEQLVAACLALCADAGWRQRLGQAGQRAMRARDLAPLLAQRLAAGAAEAAVPVTTPGRAPAVAGQASITPPTQAPLPVGDWARPRLPADAPLPIPAQPARPLRLALVYDRLLRPDTTGQYLEAALRAAGAEVWHYPPMQGGPDGLQFRGYAELPADIDACLSIDDDLAYPPPALVVPSLYWCIDVHRMDQLIGAGMTRWDKLRGFDLAWSAQRDQALALDIPWLPLAADPGQIYPLAGEHKRYDWCFVGNINTAARAQTLQWLQQHFPRCHVGQAWGEAMNRIYSQSQVILNVSHANDVNMRFFEAQLSGSPLLSNRVDNGEDALFGHLRTYASLDELGAELSALLADPAAARALGQAQRQQVLAEHSYAARAQQVLHTLRAGVAKGAACR